MDGRNSLDFVPILNRCRLILGQIEASETQAAQNIAAKEGNTPIPNSDS